MWDILILVIVIAMVGIYFVLTTGSNMNEEFDEMIKKENRDSKKDGRHDEK